MMPYQYFTQPQMPPDPAMANGQVAPMTSADSWLVTLGVQPARQPLVREPVARPAVQATYPMPPPLPGPAPAPLPQVAPAPIQPLQFAPTAAQRPVSVPVPLAVQPLAVQPAPMIRPTAMRPVPLQPMPLMARPAAEIVPTPPPTRPDADLLPGVERVPYEARKALYDQGPADGELIVEGADFGPMAPEAAMMVKKDEQPAVTLPPVPGITAPLPGVPTVTIEREEPEKDKTGLYVGLAIAGVAVIGGVVWYVTRKG